MYCFWLLILFIKERNASIYRSNVSSGKYLFLRNENEDVLFPSVNAFTVYLNIFSISSFQLLKPFSKFV